MAFLSCGPELQAGEACKRERTVVVQVSYLAFRQTGNPFLLANRLIPYQLSRNAPSISHEGPMVVLEEPDPIKKAKMPGKRK
jgi:hypothetical protein